MNIKYIKDRNSSLISQILEDGERGKWFGKQLLNYGIENYNVMKFYTIRRGLCFFKKFKNEKENEYGNKLYKNWFEWVEQRKAI